MVMIEPNKQATSTAPLPAAATKKVNPKKLPKEGASNQAIANRKGKGDGHVSRLGKLPGLSITRAGELAAAANNEDMAQALAKSSKSSMDDLSKQLHSELKKSKENVRPSQGQGNSKPRPRPSNSQANGKPQSTNRPSEVPTASRPLESGQVVASTLPTPPSKPLVTPSKPSSNPPTQPRSEAKSSSTPQQPKQPAPILQSKPSVPSPAATPAKTGTIPASSTASPSTPATELDSPAMQRKRLLDMIAAERADEEKRRKAKKMREEQRKNRAKAAQAQGQSSNIPPSSSVPTKPTVPEKPKSAAVEEKPRVKQEPRDQGQQKPRSRPQHTQHPQPAPVRRDQIVKPTAPVSQPLPPVSQPLPLKQPTIKKELIDQLDFSQAPSSVKVPAPIPQPPQPSSLGLTPQQNEVLCKQFMLKDYLSRKEMRALAIQTGLTDAKVRDWFKQKRIDEDVPTIVSEKPAEFILNPPNVKEEPQEHNDYGFETPADNNVPVEASDEVPVKQEPVEEEAGPDSAVLDPVSGKLVKQRSIDKDMETILSKAPILESLAKKIEKVNTTGNSFKESFQAKVGDIIDILDDDIVITQENIVNPGPKERPMSKVLNKFLSQVEELEKNISEGQNGSNFNLMRDNKRKEEDLAQLSSEVERQSSEINHLEKELQDKNDEIESILLNSVSKETFVRTQFQNLTSEVRQLRKENEEKKTLEEKVKDLEKQLRNKSHDCEDWKEKYDSTVANMKELEETSTNMIGEITKGVGEKLALAKTREKDLRLIEEKNLLLVEEVSKLEKQLLQLNHDHYKAREDLDTRLREKDGAIAVKDDEIEKLKGQVGNLTKRFKDKVKEIQETLSKYNETLKVKNIEIGEKSKEIEKMKETDAAQAKMITMLKASVEKFTTGKEILDKTLEETKLKLMAKDKEIEELSARVKDLSQISSKTNPASPKKTERKTKQRKPKTLSSPESSKRKLNSRAKETGSPQKKLKLEINSSVFAQPLLLPPLHLLRLPLFEDLKPLQPTISERPSVPATKEIKDYPVVLYSRNPILEPLLHML